MGRRVTWYRPHFLFDSLTACADSAVCGGLCCRGDGCLLNCSGSEWSTTESWHVDTTDQDGGTTLHPFPCCG